MNSGTENNALFSKPGYWYAGLALVIIICGFIFQGLWITDQFIVYNFLTLIVLSKICGIIVNRQRKYLKYLPLLIILYFFFSPGLLKGLLLVSHLITLACIFLQTKNQKADPVAAYFFLF